MGGPRGAKAGRIFNDALGAFAGVGTPFGKTNPIENELPTQVPRIQTTGAPIIMPLKIAFGKNVNLRQFAKETNSVSFHNELLQKTEFYRMGRQVPQNFVKN